MSPGVCVWPPLCVWIPADVVCRLKNEGVSPVDEHSFDSFGHNPLHILFCILLTYGPPDGMLFAM